MVVGQIAKARNLGLELHAHPAGRAVTLLGDDQLGDAEYPLHLFAPGFMRGFVGGVGLLGGFVIILTKHEPDHIGVLLD